MNRIKEMFELYFPMMSKKAVKYRLDLADNLIVTLDDGYVMSFDEKTKTVRRLPHDPYNMSEKECRKEFGERLYNIMWGRGLTQNDLAERTGLSQQQISSYMTGKVTPSFYNADKLAKALECSIDEFRYY